MKVILSRKGLDTGNCDIANLLMFNSHNSVEMVMLPIPANNTNMAYKDLDFSGIQDKNKNQKLISALENSKIINKDSLCHADPNIVNYFNEKEFLGSIGQVDHSQTHLENHNIKTNDIFIFFGLFNEYSKTDIDSWKINKSNKSHIMFGYLQIGDIIYPNRLSDTERKDYEMKYPWLKTQPHWKKENYIDRLNNCIYIARETCSFDNSIKGYGIFNYDKDLILTKQGQSKYSHWNLPNELKGLEISYHTQNSYKEDYFQSACRGQEFVIEESPNAEKWAQNLIKTHAKR